MPNYQPSYRIQAYGQHHRKCSSIVIQSKNIVSVLKLYTGRFQRTCNFPKFSTKLNFFLPNQKENVFNQRVLNDLQRTRLSRPRVIWLLHHSLPLYHLSIFLSLPVCHPHRWSLQTGERGRGRGWGWSQIKQRRGSLILYESSHLTDTHLALF